ncbi:MAG TPA: hypothetical protein VGC85_09150 [Chthoniobacterales bacterium]
MTSQNGGGFRLNVLSPGGRDPDQDFANDSNSASHAPVNFHAYAASTRGSFLRTVERAIEAQRPVLLLIRGDFRDSEKALVRLKEAGVPVAVSLKEIGLHQIADQLRDARKLDRFIRIVSEADGCIAPTSEAAEIFRSFCGSDKAVAFIPTPYPTQDPQWDFSRAPNERNGIFVGTREWDVLSRNHLAALVLARELSNETGATVTAYDFAGRSGKRLLDQLGFAPDKLRVLTERRGYANYLRVLAEHRIVLQLDSSFVPGQVAGDALLCRVPCVGGNGAIDRIGHPQTCGWNRRIDELRTVALKLLREPQSVEAPDAVSFETGARALADYFNSLG